MRSAMKSQSDSSARRAGTVRQRRQLRPGLLGVAADGLPGPLQRRGLPQQVERLGVQRVVGERAAGQDLAQPDRRRRRSSSPASA